MYQCGTIPVFAETPRNPNFWNCLTVYQNQHYVHSDDVYAVHVETDKQEYHTNDVVIISGYVDNIGSNTNLTITIYNPLLEVVSILQVAISDDNTFEESLPIGGSLWEQNGIYSISVQYGKAADHTDFLYLSDLESDGLL
ncbi:hypothetical protein NSED_03930 [Candidatus Nitrosopumilus sediminis]|uniref:CARDB domain-containing protein n=2 Tax=Candidatus Nitrosopumilus sediminis TaxID=1229909 RepID=K0BBT4_9ARCH|nr:hypothetical protein NSED_03930 [Candidatus Nitrosopumilus sediminis]